MPGTTPSEDARLAFKTILTNANLAVTVHERLPYEGADPRSVVLTLVSGSSRRPAIGSQISSSMRALEEPYRIQIDCYHDEQAEVGKLADKVVQVIMDHLDDLERQWDIHDVSKRIHTDMGPPEPTARESRIVLDFEFYTHRAIS